MENEMRNLENDFWDVIINANRNSNSTNPLSYIRTYTLYFHFLINGFAMKKLLDTPLRDYLVSRENIQYLQEFIWLYINYTGKKYTDFIDDKFISLFHYYIKMRKEKKVKSIFMGGW